MALVTRAALALAVATAGCAVEALDATRVRYEPAVGGAGSGTATSTGPAAVAPISSPSASPSAGGQVHVTYRVDVRVAGAEDFAPVLEETMSDPRGWSRAGFEVRSDPRASFVVVLAEGPEVDRLCLPFDTGGRFSCQNGPMVAINADRWRSGVRHWRSGLDEYRRMLINHEMGHLLGQRHRPCPGPGRPAPVMYQQSGGMGGCLENPWPLRDEVETAARHDLKLAPAYGE